MSDSNPDKPTPPSESDKERLAKIAASLPGELVSRDAAFPKKRQRPKARLPEPVRQKIETDATEEAAKDKLADGPKAPIEKPKFKVTRSPFAPRIDQTTKPADTWGDEEEAPKAESKPAPEVAKKPEPEVKKPAEPEAKKFEPKPIPRATPSKLDISRAPTPKDDPKAEEPAKPATPEVKPAAKSEAAKPEIKPAAKEEPKVVPMPKAAPAAEEKKPAETKPAAKQPLPTPVSKAGPTKLPTPVTAKKEVTPIAKPATSKLPSPAKPASAAPRSAPRPKAAPAPGRQAAQAVEETSTGMNIVWLAVDAIAAVATLAFAALTFMNMGG